MPSVTVDHLPVGTKGVPVAFSVPTTAGGIIVAAANIKRLALTIYNAGPNTIYLGSTTAVTTGTGYPVPIGGSYLDGESTDAWWAIAITGACDVRVVEVSGA